jgi:hypothetical protein
MSEESKEIQVDEMAEPVEAEKRTASEELKVQAKDLMQTISDLVREGTVRRVKVTHRERTLIDFPLVAGVPAAAVLAMQLPVLSAIVGVGALLGGCTVRVEREVPVEA